MTTRVIAVLLAAALVPRLALLFAGPWGEPERARFGDSTRYLVLAENFRTHGSFGLAEEEPAPAWSGLLELQRENGTAAPRDSKGLIPEVLRTPGYPAFVVAGTTLFGDPRGVLLLQCLLGAACAPAIARLGVALGLTGGAAAAAGLLWALHPGLIVRDCQFMTESLFNALGVFGLLAAACGPRGWRGWVLSGGLLGFAGLVRPLAAIYLPAATFFAARRADRRWIAVAVVAAAALLPSAAWAVRNAATGNGFRVSTVGHVTLFYYFAGYAISEERGVDWLTTWPERSVELLGRLRERVKPGDDIFSRMKELAVEELKARPGPAAKVLAKSWVKLYVAHSLGEVYQLFGAEYRPQNLFARLVLRENEPGGGEPVSAWAAVPPLLWVGLNAVVAGLAAIGAFLALRRRRFAFVLPLAATVLLFTAATMSQGLERMRTPFEFALFLLAVAPWGLRRES